MDVQFQVDENLCIGCGECAKDCPFQLIEMKEDIPMLTKENEANCVQCQHCLAVCSTGALSILGKNPADSIPLTGGEVPVQQLATLMKGRRSVRRYKKEPVSREEIDFLLDTVGYAPTGVNNRQSSICGPQSRHCKHEEYCDNKKYFPHVLWAKCYYANRKSLFGKLCIKVIPQLQKISQRVF